MNVSIIGLGLIGGSLALSLRQKGFTKSITGYDRNPVHGTRALELGIVDQVVNSIEELSDTDLLILAIPVDYSSALLPKLLNMVSSKTIITDVGSTKSGICQNVKDHPRRVQYVAAHPIAGTEFTGPDAAFDGLFDQKRLIICDPDLSRPDALELVQKMYESVGMKVVFMGSEEHDLHAAYVSHLSHIISFTLGLTVLDIEKDREQIFNLASSGFASTARLAKSSSEMWAPIFQQNSNHLPKAIDQFINYLSQFRDAIESNDPDKTKALMNEANKIRKILKEIDGQ